MSEFKSTLLLTDVSTTWEIVIFRVKWSGSRKLLPGCLLNVGLINVFLSQQPRIDYPVFCKLWLWIILFCVPEAPTSTSTSQGTSVTPSVEEGMLLVYNLLTRKITWHNILWGHAGILWTIPLFFRTKIKEDIRQNQFTRCVWLDLDALYFVGKKGFA